MKWSLLMCCTAVLALDGCAKPAPPVAKPAPAPVSAVPGNHDPSTFRFETADIARFWAAYDQMPTSGEPAALFDRAYLDPGTPGLHGFITDRIRSASHLIDVIQHHPKYYAAIRANTLRVSTIEPRVRDALRTFKGLYADAVFPDLYFVIGALSSGGTATPDGLIIGTEIFSRSPDVPTDELDPWLFAVTRTIDDLPLIIVHEWVHFQQVTSAEHLLGQIIQEGAADFLASLVTHGTINAHVYTYGYAHEAELKQQLVADLPGDSRAHWLYNGNDAKDRPADLGYFMGYRITQAYYERAADKRQAIIDILHVKDFDKFLADSGYLAH
jgi:hypothetical protein